MSKIMIKRGNINMIRNTDTRSKTLSPSMLAMTTLIAMMSIVISTNEHSINAQMMGDHGGFGNMTSGLQEDQQEMMINGTINLEQTIIEAIDSKVNTSLTQAITTAEQSVGNNSFALAAFGADLVGDLVYIIILGTPGTEFYNVIVDPGNGQILSSEESSQEEIEERHLKHSAVVVEDAGTGEGGFGLRALRH
ncbi:MAG: PepSY domain-containing protein [Nitrososphaeraceae archaeon]